MREQKIAGDRLATIRTLLGWWAAMTAWFASEFLQPLYDRLMYHIPDFTISFLLLWGLAPLVLLWLIRPRPARAASAAEGENK